MDRLRAEGSTVLPIEGSWVRIVGNRSARRYHRLPTFLKADLGIDHGDVVWVNKEACQYNHHALYDNLSEGEKLGDEICRIEMISEHQLTWVELPTPLGGLNRLYCGEIIPVTVDTLNEMLQAGFLRVVQWAPFAALEDELSILADAMMIDGASRELAQAAVLLACEDTTAFVPTFYFKSAGAYRATFCEVEEG